MPTTTGISRINLTADITERQFEIVEQGVLGHIVKEIAEILHISAFTVKNTFRAVYKKTGARNLQELAVWYMCKKFDAVIDFSKPMRKIVINASNEVVHVSKETVHEISREPKRALITLFFLGLILFSEFTCLSGNVRSTRARSRARTACTVRASRGRKNDLDYYIDYLIEL